MSGIQKSSALNNEPTMNASDFDKQLLRFVKDFCAPYDEMRKGLEKARVSVVDKNNHYGKDLPAWPLDTVYVSVDGFMNLYSILYDIPNMTDDLDQLVEDEVIEKAADVIITTTILCGCLSWDKVRNIVHINNKQLDDSLLDCPCASLAKLPQWAICFNTVEQNLLWNERPVAGVIFYRSFISNDLKEALQVSSNTANNVLDGEPEATINNLSTLIIYNDGEIIIGPYIELCSSGSINSYFNNMSNPLLNNYDEIAKAADQFSRKIFKLLAYFLENLDNLKNAKGEKVSFAPNPEPFKTKKGYRLFGRDRISSYYLD